MLFNSVAFAVFLTVFFALYWALRNKNVKLQNLLLLGGGYLFYGWWDWRFLGLLFFTSSVDYLIGLAIYRSGRTGKRRLLLVVSLLLNLGLLFFFKYYNFFIDSWTELCSLIGIKANPATMKIILPVGLSFYTFQSIAYVVDIYRKEIEPAKDYFTFLSFVAFFPQLVAGPISRARNLLPQFYRKRVFDRAFAVSGLRLILWGLFKKVVIADRLAYSVDLVYASPASYDGSAIFVATFFFALQIYCDFSGYSDIAMGTARLLGFDIMANFRTPYFSSSFREFWQRWHISLSTWFRDYLYKPLGGNKVSAHWKIYRNLLITFMISGLWHGASFTFICWGLLHGLFVCIERMASRKFTLPFVPAWVRVLFVFTCVTFAWIFFRASSFSDAFIVIRNAFHFSSSNDLTGMFPSVAALRYTLVSLLLFFLGESLLNKGGWERVNMIRTPVRWGLYYILAFWIILFGEFRFAPVFIYFQF